MSAVHQLCDLAAHRVSDRNQLLHPPNPGQQSKVIRAVLQTEASGGAKALAMPAEVHGDDPERRAQRFEDT